MAVQAAKGKPTADQAVARPLTVMTRVLDLLQRVQAPDQNVQSWRVWASALEIDAKAPDAIPSVAEALIVLRSDFVRAEQMMQYTAIRPENFATPFAATRPALGVELIGRNWNETAQHINPNHLAQLRAFDDLLPVEDSAPSDAELEDLRASLELLRQEAESDELDPELRALLVACVRRMEDALAEWKHLGTAAVRRAATALVEDLRIRFDVREKGGGAVPTRARRILSGLEKLERWMRLADVTLRLVGRLLGESPAVPALPPFKEPLALPPGEVVHVGDDLGAEDPPLISS